MMRCMTELLHPNDLVPLDELAISTMWETSALVELLERKGILTKQGVLDMIGGLRWGSPWRSGNGGLMREGANKVVPCASSPVLP